MKELAEFRNKTLKPVEPGLAGDPMVRWQATPQTWWPFLPSDLHGISVVSSRKIFDSSLSEGIKEQRHDNLIITIHRALWNPQQEGPDLTPESHECQCQTWWKQQCYLQGAESWWVSMVPSICIFWTRGRISSAVWCFVMQSRWAGASVLRAETKNEQRSERNISISPPLLSQPKLISRCFSGQKNPSICKLCRICEKTQRLGETEDSHINPHHMPTLENTNPTVQCWKKPEPDQCCILTQRLLGRIFKVYLGTASRITFTHFFSSKFSSPCLFQWVSLSHQTKAPFHNFSHYFQVQDEHVCKKLILLIMALHLKYSMQV